MKKTSTTKKRSSAKRKYSAPALDKGLDILELFSTESGGMTLSDIAQKLNRSVGEIFRMLAVLEQRRYLTYDTESDRYILTLKMFELSHRHPPIKRLLSVALPIMQKMAYKLEQSCHLVIYYEGMGLVIAQTDSPSAHNFSVRLGAKAELPFTCSGHLLLAFENDEERKNMLSAQPAKVKKATNMTALNKIIKRVKQQGYEAVTSTQIQGVQDIGFPVFDYSGKIVAALTSPFLEHLDDPHQISLDEARKELEKSAFTISRHLGYDPVE